jgi:hypothetical protein
MKIYYQEDIMKKLLFVVLCLTAVIGTSLFAQTRTPLQLPAKIGDGFGKTITYKVTAPNIIEVRGAIQDMGAIYLRDIPYNGQKNLIIKIRSMTGKFRWDHGKMFGVTLGSPNEPKSFLESPGRKLMDKMIDGPFAVGDEVVFPLPEEATSKPGKISFAMTTYGGATFAIELYFE